MFDLTPLYAHCWRTQQLTVNQINKLAAAMQLLPDVMLGVELAEMSFKQVSVENVRHLTNKAMQCHLVPTDVSYIFRLPQDISIGTYELACQAVGYAGLALATEGSIPAKDTNLLMRPWRQVMQPNLNLAVMGA